MSTIQTDNNAVLFYNQPNFVGGAQAQAQQVGGGDPAGGDGTPSDPENPPEPPGSNLVANDSVTLSNEARVYQSARTSEAPTVQDTPPSANPRETSGGLVDITA